MQIELPDDFVPLLGGDLAATVREALLLQLVHEEKMTVARAGQLLGLDREAWYAKIARRKSGARTRRC